MELDASWSRASSSRSPVSTKRRASHTYSRMLYCVHFNSLSLVAASFSSAHTRRSRCSAGARGRPMDTATV